MKLFGIALTIMAFMTGCTSLPNRPIDSKASQSLNGQTVTYTVRAKPDFVAMTPVKAAFGIFGVAAMVSDGNSIVTENNVDDPAQFISLGLLKSLENVKNVKIITPPILVDSKDVEQIIAKANNARFVIDIQTFNWQFVYFSTDWTHYRVNYGAMARLIDTQSKQVVAEGSCYRMPAQTNDAPTYDGLVLNRAAGLKRELAIAANECLNKFNTGMLALIASSNTLANKAVLAPEVTNQAIAPATTHAVTAAPTLEQSVVSSSVVSAPLVSSKAEAIPAIAPRTAAIVVPVEAAVSSPSTVLASNSVNNSSTLQTVEFRVGSSSVTVEKMAKQAGCVGGKGAGLVTPKGAVEVYRMACDNGGNFVAKCEMRQCSAM